MRRTYYKKNSPIRRCTLCWEIKDKDEFYKIKKISTGYDGTCKECRRLTSRTNYKRKNVKMIYRPILDNNKIIKKREKQLKKEIKKDSVQLPI